MSKQTNNTLAIFDLDNTLLGGDSDHAWGEYLIENQHIDAEQSHKKNEAFYRDYQQGTLDIDAYLRFVLGSVKGKSLQEIQPLLQDFVQKKIKPMWLPAAEALLQKHKNAGDYLLIITATSHFITQPIAQLLGVDALLASEAEMVNNQFTGNPSGIPCFQQGKVQRLQHWLTEHPYDISKSYFYSDSFNDLPLLKAVGHPIAVDPDKTLRKHAQQNNWPIISLR